MTALTHLLGQVILRSCSAVQLLPAPDSHQSSVDCAEVLAPTIFSIFTIMASLRLLSRHFMCFRVVLNHHFSELLKSDRSLRSRLTHFIQACLDARQCELFQEFLRVVTLSHTISGALKVLWRSMLGWAGAPWGVSLLSGTLGLIHHWGRGGQRAVFRGTISSLGLVWSCWGLGPCLC